MLLKDLPKLTEKDWIGDASNGLYVRNLILNKKINELLTEARDWVYDRMLKGHHMSLEIIKQHFQKPETHKNFNAFAKHYVRTINKNKNDYEKLEYRTIQAYLSFLKKLDMFDPRISFDQINTNFLEEFDRFLATTHNLRSQTRRKHFDKLSTTYQAACKQGLLAFDPLLFKYKIKPNPNEKSLRVSLDLEEIRMLKNTKLKNPTDEYYKSIFLFSCLTGLYYSDVSDLLIKNIRVETIMEGGKRKEVEFIEGNRYKNGEKYIVPIFNETHSILQKHSNYGSKSKHDELLFEGLISPQKYNQKLKKVAEQVGINKKLSAVVARHSFAEMVRTMGMSSEKIAKAMGHQRLQTQETYSKLSASNAIRGWTEPDL